MADICAACAEPLLIKADDDDDDEDVSMDVTGSSSNTVHSPGKLIPDDCSLRCGHHYHWYCLLESFKSTSCPSCETDLSATGPNGQVQLLCDLHNEGGYQPNHDVLPALREESYVLAHPGERKPRAFLEFCKNGDVPAIVEMMATDDEEDEEDEQVAAGFATRSWGFQDLLRYQDPVGEGWSGLHVAVINKNQEVVWLLLLLGSHLDMSHFPSEVMQEAVTLGVERPNMGERVDIRSLTDTRGRTAEHLAAEIGQPWTGWLGKGLLSI